MYNTLSSSLTFVEIRRKIFTDISTIGELWLDGKFYCHTLEDAVRPLGVKIPGKTAIYTGDYILQITKSNRFGILMPELINVPYFTGIRIHAGNADKNTDGCILVGRYDEKTPNFISDSRAAFEPLNTMLKHLYGMGTVICSIRQIGNVKDEREYTNRPTY